MANKKGKDLVSDNSREIVGWFTRGGKHIPVYAKDGHKDVKGKSQKESQARKETARREERKDELQRKSEENRSKSIKNLESQEGKEGFGSEEIQMYGADINRTFSSAESESLNRYLNFSNVLLYKRGKDGWRMSSPDGDMEFTDRKELMKFIDEEMRIHNEMEDIFKGNGKGQKKK